MAKLLDKKKTAAKEGDELIGLGQQALHWANERPRQVAAAAAGGVAVLLLILGSLLLTGKAEEKRIGSVAAAVSRYTAAGEANGGAAIEELRRLSDKYSRFEEGGQARYFLAGSLAGGGDLQGAAAEYEKVIQDFSANVNLAGMAGLGLAYTYRLMGEEEKALETLLGLQGQTTIPLPQSQIGMEVGRVYEALGKKEDALSAYRALVEDFPDSSVSQQAQKRISYLEGA
jgi:tetratricopeptide (TPR) repeat protein